MSERLVSILFANGRKFSWICLIIKFLELVSLTNGKKLPLDNYNVPCGYFDTVNLTNSTKFLNGSYLYQNDILIPKTYVGIYDYVLINNSHRVTVPQHPRGCACELTSKKCIRLCCNVDEIYEQNFSECRSLNDSEYTNDMIINKNNGSSFEIDVFNYFIPQMNYRPCDGFTLYPLEKGVEGDEFIVFENGDVMMEYDETIVGKEEMCFGHAFYRNGSRYAYATVHLCEQPAPVSIRRMIYGAAMLFSIPFMVITILVYTLIPELRNLHGKALSCYLFNLVVGYSLMGSHAFIKGIPPVACKTTGFITHFCFMSAFFWLSVISFDLWWNFRGTRGRNLRDSKRFYIFSLYAWGLAFICTGITIFAQLTDYVPDEYKPGIGGGDFCWLDVEQNYSAFAYFFGPLLAILSFNIVMFIITSLKIHHVQREVAKMIAREDSRRNLRSEKDQHGLFLRLFIVMGVTWSMEMISYLLGEQHAFAWFFHVMDVCNAIQGFLIFALFVLKKKVKHLIFKSAFAENMNSNAALESFRNMSRRFSSQFIKSKTEKTFKKARDINRSSQYSTKTTCSNITLTTLSHPMTEKPLMDPRTKE